MFVLGAMPKASGKGSIVCFFHIEHYELNATRFEVVARIHHPQLMRDGVIRDPPLHAPRDKMGEIEKPFGFGDMQASQRAMRALK